ncbi:MAG TPA: SIMPL domain-containing protein [Sandaracinaceae bacterium]
MKTTLRILVSLIVTFAIGCGAVPARVVMPEDAEGIRVSGRGEARARPDVAVLEIGVESRRPTVEEARAQAAAAQNAVLEALRGAGVEERDIQTRQLSIHPDFEYSQTGRRLLGYVVTNTVEARIRDLDRIEHAVDTAVAAGGDLTRLNGLRFELSEPEEVQRRARAEAIANARAEAEQLAEALGVRLGEPLSVDEVASEPVRPVMMRMEMADAAASRPIRPGETEVVVEVRVRWAIAR